MSKFVDMLSKIGQVSQTPLGFGARNRQEKSVATYLVGALSVKDLSNTALLEMPVDCFLVIFDHGSRASIGKLLSNLEGRLWGARLPADGSPKVEALKEKGCDFLLFEAEGTSAEVLLEESLGRVITTNLGLEESVARGIDGLPIDAVLIDPQQKLLPLTVMRMIEIQATRDLIDKPCLLTLGAPIDSKALEGLQDVGIEGLVVGLADFGAESLQEMKQAIDALPRRKARRDRGEHIVPRIGAFVGFEPGGQQEEHDDDDDDEDF